MANKQYFGIKYPFTSEGYQHFYVDTNEDVRGKVRSALMHVVFTPKGQRIRMPQFGTDLIKFIFEANDDVTWSIVKDEVDKAVRRWVPNVNVNNVQVVRNEEDESEIFVRLDYSVSDGNKVTTDSVAIQV